MYTHAFAGMLKTREERGMDKGIFTYWTSPEAVFDWWIGQMKDEPDPNQLRLEDVL